MKAHDLNAALLSGGDLRKAAYAHWLAGDLPGADKLFERYLEFRAKLKDPTLEMAACVMGILDGAQGASLRAAAEIAVAPKQHAVAGVAGPYDLNLDPS